MWYGNIFDELKSLQNPERAIPMAAYMRNQFPFLGVSAGPRKLVGRPYLKTAIQNRIIDFEFVEKCFEKEEREFHQLAVEVKISDSA